MTLKAARQRSLPNGAMGTSSQRDAPGRRYCMTADTASWPSVKMSASTTTRSPTARLMGNWPASISGLTPSMRTLRRPSLGMEAALGAGSRAVGEADGALERILGDRARGLGGAAGAAPGVDRKSTRLNSSHLG